MPYILAPPWSPSARSLTRLSPGTDHFRASLAFTFLYAESNVSVYIIYLYFSLLRGLVDSWCLKHLNHLFWLERNRLRRLLAPCEITTSVYQSRSNALRNHKHLQRPINANRYPAKPNGDGFCRNTPSRTQAPLAF